MTWQQRWPRPAWIGLGEYVRFARGDLGITQLELAVEAGVSPTTIRNIEQGRTRGRMPLHIGRVEAALGWMPGSAERVLEGGHPTPIRKPRKYTSSNREAIRQFLEEATCPPGTRYSLLRQLERL